MLGHTLRRIRRAPLPALGVLAFAVVLAAVLCRLQAGYEAELRNYEEVYRSIPVEVAVSNLTGNRRDRLDAPSWVYEVFTGVGWTNDLGDYVTDLEMKSLYYSTNGLLLVGLTSLSLARELQGGEVVWREGYDESILKEEDRAVCLISKELETVLRAQQGPDGPLEMRLDFKNFDPMEQKTYEYECVMEVVGVYDNHESGMTVYAPWNVIERVFGRIRVGLELDMISGTLVDNSLLEELRETAGAWFAEPTPTGEKVPWDTILDYDYYPYALVIDDSLLLKAAATLQNSLTVNRVSTLIVFLLSAGAGAFIGFLTIRQRRREIALMRTLGTRYLSIYAGYTLEQMLCVILGMAIGGAPFGWQPLERLAISTGVYFVSLTVSLIVALRRNLLTTIKEDE